VELEQLGEAARIALRGFDQQPFLPEIVGLRLRAQQRLRGLSLRRMRERRKR